MNNRLLITARFNFKGWTEDVAIINAMPDQGSGMAPAVFMLDGSLYLLTGVANYSNTYGYKYTSGAWVVNTSIISGLTNLGRVHVFIAPNGGTYAVTGYVGGAFSGYRWTGSTWTSDSYPITGLTDVGDYSAPTVYVYKGDYYLLSGSGNTGFFGWKWNGASWSADQSITVGLVQGNWGRNAPTVFLKGGFLCCVVGSRDAVYNGYLWDGTQWQSNLELSSGLVAAPLYTTTNPTSFYYEDKLYIIIARSLWEGYVAI